MGLRAAAICALEGVTAEGGVTKARLDLGPAKVACITSPGTGLQQRHAKATRAATSLIVVVFLASLYQPMAMAAMVVSPCSASATVDIASQEMVTW